MELTSTSISVQIHVAMQCYDQTGFLFGVGEAVVDDWSVVVEIRLVRVVPIEVLCREEWMLWDWRLTGRERQCCHPWWRNLSGELKVVAVAVVAVVIVVVIIVHWAERICSRVLLQSLGGRVRRLLSYRRVSG